MIVYVIILYSVIIITASEEGPNITMLYGNSRYICVASGDETISQAQTFITPISSEQHYINDFAIKNNNTEKYNCDFEKYCEKYNKFEISNSQNYRFYPVFDDRWNKFYLFRTKEFNQKEGFKVKENNFYMSVSIRGNQDAQILLCEYKNYNCYWILIDGGSQKDNTKIRQCSKLPDKFPSRGSPCAITRDETNGTKFLSTKKWTHFIIARENNNRILLWESSRVDKPILNYTDNEKRAYSIKNIFFRSYEGSTIEWRIHDYNFIDLSSFGKNQQHLLIGEISFPELTEQCFSMYVALCSQCTMNITLQVDTLDTEIFEMVEGTEESFYKWKQVKIRPDLASFRKIYIYVKISTKNNEFVDSPFWLIDDIRFCSSKDIKVGSVRTNGVVSCESLFNSNDWHFSDINLSHENAEELECFNPDRTGKYCDIDCSEATGQAFCDKQKICVSSKNNINRCTCASGYIGNNCEKECSHGFYGYNCIKKCGKCLNNEYCNKYTGECSYCAFGLVEPFCNTTYLPRLLNAPEIIDVSTDRIIVQFKNITVDGKVEPTQFQLQYKKEGESDWSSYSDKRPLPKIGTESALTNLEKETSYSIRAILFTQNNNSYSVSDDNNEFGVPHVEAKTLCDDIKLVIKESTTSVEVAAVETNFTCKSYNYDISINNENREIAKYERFAYPLVFNNLFPYTNYEVILTYVFKPFNKINQKVTTLEDAPSRVLNISHNKLSDTEVTLVWQLPEQLNGIIKEFLIVYKHVRYISCKEQAVAYENNVTVEYVENWNPEVTLKNLNPYSIYNVMIAAKTVKRGEFSYFQFETKSSTVSNDELPLLSSIKFTPSSNTARVQWDLPNCENIRGELIYQFMVKCINEEWCDEFKTQTTTISSSYKSAYFLSLIPFTTYQIEVRALHRDSDELSTGVITKEFDTLPGEAPSIRNFTVYSKDNNSISFRWLPPYPPNGQLEYYLGSTCYRYYASGCRLEQPIKINAMPCNLWEENYICYTWTNLYNDYDYDFGIAAKNKDARQSPVYSYKRIVKVQLSNKGSSKPLNLSNKWDNDSLTLYWNHPDMPHGPIKSFYIKLSQRDSDIQQIEETVISEYLNVNEPMKIYTKNIPKRFQYSSSYEITIYAVTSAAGDPATLIIHTPPETPELLGQVKLREDAITNSSVLIQVPTILKTTISKDSKMYIIVNQLSTKMKPEIEINDNLSDLEEYVNNKCSTPEAILSWIALELTLEEMVVDIVIGNGNAAYSRRLNKTIRNYQLSPESIYDICLILINEYRTQKSFKTYRLENIRTADTSIPSSGTIYILLLLLLILPLVIFYIYRRYSRTNMGQSTFHGLRMPMLNTSSSQQVSEIQLDPDIIPLTEETSATNSSRNYTPTVVVNSNKSAPPKVTTSATTNFHSRLVPINKYEEYLKDTLESNELAKQHALFPRGQTKPWDYGMLKENKFKNRYNNLIAYDRNRVKLEKISNDHFSDYINASYIHGYKQNNAYIATQGPKLTTVNDFWRMVWQEKVQYIVMLANVIEGGKKKCEKYWPEISSSQEYGTIEVSFEKNDIYADFEYRTFTVSNNNEKRTVTQLHFTSWPDHGVPLYPQSLVPFLKKILTIPQSTAPIVVHCSAGVGRTGTIILCDICLRMAAREGQVDVLRYLHEIREQRANMVDNIDQYKLVHMVILECLLAPDTNIPCNANFSATVQTLIEDGGLQVQLSYLQNNSWQDKALNFSSVIPQNPLNDSKNRFNDIKPVTNQIFLPRYPLTDETSDYINAIPVDGFRFKEQFIVTQTPMPNTIVDFWRMIGEKSIKIIVSLNNIPDLDATGCIFWPTDNEEMQLTPRFSLKYNKLLPNSNYDIHSILFNDNETEEQSLKVVQIVQFKNWDYPSVLPSNLENLITLYEETENLSRGNYPVVVSCYDGALASGLFVAMSFVIEKIKLEQQCDPCLAVRVIRRNRKQFIKNKTQFESLYKLAVIYLNMFETYSNFDLLNDQILKK